MYAPALTPVDVSSIKATIKPWSDACLKRDWDALLGMCTDDVVFLPPDEPMVTGKKLRTWLEAYPVIRRFESDFDHIEGQDHLATAFGTFHMTLDLKGKAVEVTGKFVDTFRRDDHGKWLYAHVIWNSNAPITAR